MCTVYYFTLRTSEDTLVLFLFSFLPSHILSHFYFNSAVMP